MPHSRQPSVFYCLPGLILVLAAHVAAASGCRADSRSVDAADKLVAAAGVLDRARESIAPMTEALRRNNPGVPEELWENFAARITEPTVLTPMYASAFRRHLASEDIDELVNFYCTPLGLRLKQASTQIETMIASATKSWATSLASELLAGAETGASSGDDSAARLRVHSSRTAAIRALLRASGAEQEAQQTSQSMIERLSAAGLDAATIARARVELSSGERLMELWIPAYERYFSVTDIDALTRFYSSPLGTRWMRALPLIKAEALIAATDTGNTAAKQSIRDVLGPLPQWRLMHPLKHNVAAEPAPK